MRDSPSDLRSTDRQSTGCGAASGGDAEPWIPFWGTLALQASRFNHSRTSPGLLPYQENAGQNDFLDTLPCSGHLLDSRNFQNIPNPREFHLLWIFASLGYAPRFFSQGHRCIQHIAFSAGRSRGHRLSNSSLSEEGFTVTFYGSR